MVGCLFQVSATLGCVLMEDNAWVATSKCAPVLVATRDQGVNMVSRQMHILSPHSANLTPFVDLYVSHDHYRWRPAAVNQV